MNISKTLKEAVSKNNVSSMRGIMYSIVHEDPGFRTAEFDDNLKYIINNYDGDIFEIDNGNVIKPKENWTEDYWAELASELMDNFSKKRINHLKEVGRYLYGIQEKTTVNNTPDEQQIKAESPNDNNTQFEWIKWGLISAAGICLLYKIFKRGK